MHPNSSIPSALIKQPAVCTMLDLSRSGLDKLKKRDPLFPKPLKEGNSRQAAVYYVVAEIESWLAAKMAARGTPNCEGS